MANPAERDWQCAPCQRLGRSSTVERRAAEAGKEVVFRADAAFARPTIYEALAEWGVRYPIPPPVNDSLERDIAELLTRPVGRPSR